MTKPQLLIHIGHGKTGSTAIQRMLDVSRAPLEQAGVVVAEADGHANHQQIFAFLTDLPKQNLPAYQDADREMEKARNDGARLWARLQERIEAVQPTLVILSCENQFRPYPPEAFARMNAALAPHFDDVRVMAYLRAPASYFLSAAQQDLKKRPEFELPSASRFRDTLEPWGQHGPGPIEVRRFARDALEGGDVVTDFIARDLPMIDPAALRRGPDDENETVSPEAMEVLQQYFRGQIRAPHRHYDRRPQRYKWLVRHADAVVPGQRKPRLLPGLREVIEARCTDLDWLAETHGLRFPEIGAPAMPREEAEARHAALRDVAQICTVDAARKQALLNEIARRARAETGPLARIRSLFGGR